MSSIMVGHNQQDDFMEIDDDSEDQSKAAKHVDKIDDTPSKENAKELKSDQWAGGSGTNKSMSVSNAAAEEEKLAGEFEWGYKSCKMSEDDTIYTMNYQQEGSTARRNTVNILLKDF